VVAAMVEVKRSPLLFIVISSNRHGINGINQP